MLYLYSINNFLIQPLNTSTSTLIASRHTFSEQHFLGFFKIDIISIDFMDNLYTS